MRTSLRSTDCTMARACEEAFAASTSAGLSDEASTSGKPHPHAAPSGTQPNVSYSILSAALLFAAEILTHAYALIAFASGA